MRRARVFTVAVVALGAALVLAPEAHAAVGPSAPYDALTVRGAGDSNVLTAGQSRVFDDSNASFSLESRPGWLYLSVGSSVGQWDAGITAPTGGELTVGATYPTASLAD